MSVPTVTSISPSVVRTAGRTLVEVIGTGFPPPPVAPADAPLPVPAPLPTVTVTVDGEPADHVEVAAEDGTRLFFVTRAHAHGPVTVVFQNLDLAGLPVAGEAVTVAAGLEYRRPVITSESKGIVKRITQEVLRLLRRDIMDNVRTPPSVDFDRFPEDAQNYIDASKLPLVCLFGPDPRLQRVLRPSTPMTEQVGPEYKKRRPTRAYDLLYRLIVVTDDKGQLDNLKVVVPDFFTNNGYIYIDKDAANPGLGKAKYEMDIEGGHGSTSLTTTPTIGTGLADVRAFGCSFFVQTVDLGDLFGFEDDAVRERGGTMQEFNLGARQRADESEE